MEPDKQCYCWTQFDRAGNPVAVYYVTDAARLIASLPPWKFNANRAGQLGNRCVRELEKIFTVNQ